MLQIAHLKKRIRIQELRRFLLSCRVTPNSTTKTASSELLHHRTVFAYLKELPSNKNAQQTPRSKRKHLEKQRKG